ncbi:MAG: hypothetical protein PHT69_06045 [Bacteroidales bacterium]|nr:hypothetical protein [Bacteroidales bacterium]
MSEILIRLLLVMASFFCFVIHPLFSQNLSPSVAASCIQKTCLNDSSFSNADGLKISNETDSLITLMFDFEKHGFFDESTLIDRILKDIDTLETEEEKQLQILDNIAALIKSPNHRNFHLLFVSNEPGIRRKMYSPMVMLTSFYDMQCHHFQRLAAQIAVLTPYFEKEDFENYYMVRHNVLGVRIGNKFVFHDFDPGQPGYRFRLNDSTGRNNVYAGIYDLSENRELISDNQFYLYKNKSLCPWISQAYYKSSFEKVYRKVIYNDLNSVFGFIPQWTIPPKAALTFNFPDTTELIQFGVQIQLNRNDSVLTEIFKAYDVYAQSKSEDDSLIVCNLFHNYLKTNFHFEYDINYLYLFNNGLISLGDSSFAEPILKNFLLKVDVETGADTLFFLKDFFIPLPLHKVIIEKGGIYIQEQEFTRTGLQKFEYEITDSLSFDLYNLQPPIFTSDSIRKPFTFNDKPLIFGPSDGYIKPHTKSSLYFYYNPFYYSFQDRTFNIRYISTCDKKVTIRPE